MFHLSDEELSSAEQRAMSVPEGTHVPLSPADLGVLLANVAYHASLGDPASATHFRRGLTDGSCLHLIIAGESAELHRDRYDPHAGPAFLAAHLMTEAPRPAASVMLALAGLLGRVSR
jgi:hypothetical protein